MEDKYFLRLCSSPTDLNIQRQYFEEQKYEVHVRNPLRDPVFYIRETSESYIVNIHVLGKYLGTLSFRPFLDDFSDFEEESEMEDILLNETSKTRIQIAATPKGDPKYA